MVDKINIIECPRDAIQGIKQLIDTKEKLKYLQSIIDTGFDVIDIGSFVSPKAIPQMSDTGKIIDSIDLSNSSSDLLVIVANVKGALKAVQYEKISFIGYPFSVSETFQIRNTNKTIKESIKELSEIIAITEKANKKMVVYLSMCFGNPYGDSWNIEIVNHWVNQLNKLGVKIISLSDTIGTANPSSIKSIFTSVSKNHKKIEFGAHLHSDPNTINEKISSAFDSGCRRFDGVMKGFGGCPMASDKLVGNIPTESIISFVSEKKINTNINIEKFKACLKKSEEFYLRYN